ncbi:hypothetical protein Kpol_2002p40 [Vanderwaltozyma polyspora DSM 70294]|uniref:Histidine biosynthesis trifunctional protein n=1 Tax=Vanderwaltozyma polyspora (strain ATCC 22028 / DSM 70294 / BCRC 21397 / CBS 2163 / NBRC 10782 / NRRL Y-8283 / UCD 57-17) TaxID=436907 RepID=A7TFF6_VANPO|nr:uncharacterized protein Kpol_2002p40 [Vanderwaltozyma polyspora DSM 70294]EDO18970.1 hypothetical protein Kpol_2002p40 [Vanderwaltozyma polyspora DSM 70294]
MVFPVLPRYTSDPIQVISERPFLLITGQALIDANKVKKDEIIEFIRKYGGYLKFTAVYVESDELLSGDDIVDLLNNGVTNIFTSNASFHQFLINEYNIPQNRVVVSADGTYTVKVGIVDTFTDGRIVNIEDLDAQSISKSLISSLKTDRPDRLFPTLVVDTAERCLGLVYSSQESIQLAIERQVGVYFSRSRNQIWVKGETSGNTQKLINIQLDCDGDALKYVVIQGGAQSSFCHLNTESCFGQLKYGLTSLETFINQRKLNAPAESYTKRLFNDSKLLNAKIKEEAEELTEAQSKDEVAWEAADLLYFTITKLVAEGVTLQDVENNLELKHLKVTRRKGDAKPKFIEDDSKSSISEPKEINSTEDKPIHLKVISSKDKTAVEVAVSRPIQKTSEIMHLVNPIVENVKNKGDKALIDYTAKFDGVQLTASVLEAPFPEEYFEGLTEEMKQSLDLSMENVRKFHSAQLQKETMVVETQPGVVCSRFSRPIEKVGLYIPGGTAILPSTALMLGVPAQVAGCKDIVFASPPRKSDGKVSPEVVYVASKVGASKIVLAGGAQAVAAMAYGTETVPKVDKILGPGNQFVTAAKMYVQNDTQALCSIDMPAGPSEVLVICDENADVDFVASDLLSQAEHGTDSQVILVGVNLSDEKIQQIQNAVHNQAMELPRVDIVRKCIAHSSIINSDSYDEAFEVSNKYAPEHLILQIEDAQSYINQVDHAGSVFVGAYTPESCGDYSSGTNHTLPTYGYARQYSGVNTSTFQKFITAQKISPEGLKSIGKAVMCVAKVEGLDGHRNAVKIRMQKLGQIPQGFI